MSESVLSYFTDPVLRAPTIGCMFMCMAAALVGVIVFLKKESLVGESLSHAAYPGVIVGVIIAGLLGFNDHHEIAIAVLVMGGAFVTSVLGLWSVKYLQGRMKVRSDSALCFVLAAFFGIGLTLASRVQFSFSKLYRQAQVYLYGQAATMTDIHIIVYGLLALAVAIVIAVYYKEIETIAFDAEYARSIGMNTKAVDGLIFFLIVLAVVIGIRSVGVVLMSAMLIAPAVAARQYTDKLHKMFILSAVFGVLSGFLGNYFSVAISRKLMVAYPETHISMPTGPSIVLVASLLCVLSLMFAPKRGFLLRMVRVLAFKYRCMCENLLKAIWRFGPHDEVSFDKIAKYQSSSHLYLRLILWRLIRQGWVRESQDGYRLTPEGVQWAARIVRLHRLWEVYLVDYMGVGVEKVHRSAEEMEHIITPDLEVELTLLLRDPKVDPHQQPIPSMEA